jgi:hypothetical protein
VTAAVEEFVEPAIRWAPLISGEVGEWGHVGLSLGGGRVIHAWDDVRVDSIADIEGLARNDGWSAPRLLGWVAPERFLRGWRPRTWNDA